VTIFLLIISVMIATPARAQQKPFTQEQVQGMVRDGFGDESGAKLIEQRGLNFTPTEGFIQSLKAAGASEAFLKALRPAKNAPAESGARGKALNQVQIITLLAGQIPSHRVAMLIKERGIDFEPTPEYLQQIQEAGGDSELVSALQVAKVTARARVDPAFQTRQSEVGGHAERATEFLRNKQYPEAEAEYREAIRLDPGNSDLHLARGVALGMMTDWDGDIAEQRQALHLNPDNENAHLNLGIALGHKGDHNGKIAEYREALRQNPNNGSIHLMLGVELSTKGDVDGAIIEYREAVRINPNDANLHNVLGTTLALKSDWDGAMGEYHEALRLKPNNALAHFNLGWAIEQKADYAGALQEYRWASELDPSNANYRMAADRVAKQVPL